MKTRTTRLTLSHSEGVFEVEIVDEGVGEYVMVSCGLDRPPFEQRISIGPSEWPFLRDAIDRMFVEIAEHESEAKLKELLKTPAPWEDEPYDPPSNVLAAVEEDSGWIPWNGGECPAGIETKQVVVRLRGYPDSDISLLGRKWTWIHTDEADDIIAYKVVD